MVPFLASGESVVPTHHCETTVESVVGFYQHSRKVGKQRARSRWEQIPTTVDARKPFRSRCDDFRAPEEFFSLHL